MVDDLLHRAISAIKAGDKIHGRQLLIQVLEQDSKNESAWLWMSKCVTQYEHKKECIERVLKINPKNPYALEGLKRLEASRSNVPALKQSRPITSRQPKKKKVNVLLAEFIVIMVLLLFGIPLLSLTNPLTGSSNTNTSATSVPIIIDVPSLFGKSLSEIRATYKLDVELHLLSVDFGYEGILPDGTLSEGYTDGKYSFWIFYNENQEAIGFQIYDGLESHHLRISDWREITQMLNLNVTQPPDFINDWRADYRVEWNNYLGYHIEVIRGISTDYVFCVFVAIMR